MKKQKRQTPEPVELRCPKCGYTEIIYIPNEKIPLCPKCRIEMVFEELLDEGKSF
jgi:predicted nucleic-acid-binding Zn-ribbon protein